MIILYVATSLYGIDIVKILGIVELTDNPTPKQAVYTVLRILPLIFFLPMNLQDWRASWHQTQGVETRLQQ